MCWSCYATQHDTNGRETVGYGDLGPVLMFSLPVLHTPCIIQSSSCPISPLSHLVRSSLFKIHLTFVSCSFFSALIFYKSPNLSLFFSSCLSLPPLLMVLFPSHPLHSPSLPPLSLLLSLSSHFTLTRMAFCQSE